MSIYDREGRCLETHITVRVCSPSPGGAVDPTTARDYMLWCGSCKGLLFKETLDEFLQCKGCGAQHGYKIHEEESLH